MIIHEVINQLMSSVKKLERTVDTLKFGDPSREVTGIATTFIATHEVIQKTIEQGKNLLITHEAIFYNHFDQHESFLNQPVYHEKLKLIEESGLSIFRFHDYMHRARPDGIIEGIIRAVGWENYVDQLQDLNMMAHPTPITIPKQSVKEIALHFKEKLGIPFVRVVGDTSMTCSRVGILPGYGGTGASAIPFFQNEDLDLIISGEGPEWEAPEYVRDAVFQGKNKALIVLGHLKSEEVGMKLLAEQLQGLYPSIAVDFIEEKQPFTII